MKTKKCIMKRKLKYEDYKYYLKAAQVKNLKKPLKKIKIDLDSPKEFIKNNRLILKTPQRFKS